MNLILFNSTIHYTFLLQFNMQCHSISSCHVNNSSFKMMYFAICLSVKADGEFIILSKIFLLEYSLVDNLFNIRISFETWFPNVPKLPIKKLDRKEESILNTEGITFSIFLFKWKWKFTNLTKRRFHYTKNCKICNLPKIQYI